MTVRTVSVLHVVLRFDKGGLEMTALNLCRELRKRGHRSEVLALDGGGETFDLARSEGINCLDLGGRQMKSPWFHLRVLRALRSIRPDVVHTHHFSALVHTLPAGLVAGRFRRVHTEHSRLYLEERPDYHRSLQWTSRAVDNFVVVGESMLSWYRDQIGVRPTSLQVIANGVDTARYCPAVPAERNALRQRLGLPAGVLVGSVGRLAAVKNYPMLLRALADVRKSRQDVGLVLVGDGPDRTVLETLCRELGLDGCVHFVGWQRETAPWLRALDLFALSSKSEAMPLALLEAMACGLPTLATAVGDVTAIVNDARGGVVVPSDDQGKYADALSVLAGMADRSHLGRSARAAVEGRYSIAAMTESYLKAYGA